MILQLSVVRAAISRPASLTSVDPYLRIARLIPCHVLAEVNLLFAREEKSIVVPVERAAIGAKLDLYEVFIPLRQIRDESEGVGVVSRGYNGIGSQPETRIADVVEACEQLPVVTGATHQRIVEGFIHGINADLDVLEAGLPEPARSTVAQWNLRGHLRRDTVCNVELDQVRGTRVTERISTR